ncbi:MAG: alkaline phosphatase family protein [Anaerolineae bacterium]|nr:alkaline phosphatase family protein [Anaerolineae bacterium]
MSRKKTLVLSIDSGCWEYLDPLLAVGRLPNVARLIETGVRGVLESTMPPITPVAFSSFITGTNPGKHGVFDWTVRRADGSTQPASASVRRGMPFWHYLNRAGVRVGIFNIPVTYPPQPIEGFLVPGITVPRNTRNLTYPPGVQDWIEARYGSYQVDVPHELLDDEGVEAYVSAWLRYEEMQTDIALALMGEYDVDVLAFNYASLDRINHFSPNMADIERTLTNVDAQIGRFVEHYPEANFILMSDHGSRRVKSAFLLGKWLAQHGYAVYGEKSLDIPTYEINFALAQYFRARGMNGTSERVLRNLLKSVLSMTPAILRRPVWQAMYRAAPQALAYRFTERLDWARTRAYAMSNSGPILINVRGRDGVGVVRERDYEPLREMIIRDLLAVEDPVNGGKVFQQVYRREEIYHGPALELAPDIVADHYSSACDLIVDNEPQRFCFVNRLNRFGDHVRGGLFVLSGPDFVADDSASRRASIMDLPATVLHLHGVPIPEDWDGQVMSEFFTPEFMAEHPLRTQSASTGATPVEQPEYGDDEIEELTGHLRGLGYL